MTSTVKNNQLSQILAPISLYFKDLDEPTNHINFRHIPIIAEALNTFEGAMIIVSHVPDFIAKIRIDDILDLEK